MKNRNARTLSRKQTHTGRRETLKSLGKGAAGLGTIATMPETWVRPVIDTVILPAHASCSISECFEVSLDLFDFDPTPPSGGNAGFVVEMLTEAPQCEAVEVSVSVDNGRLFGTLSDTIYSGSSMIFAWFGEGEPGIGVPLVTTILTVDRLCANGEKHSDTFDLRELANASR